MGGGNNKSLAWDAFIRTRVFPRVRGMALKRPDKLLVVLDREGRSDCSPDLATYALNVLQQTLTAENIICNVAVLVCDRSFENVIFADTKLVDRLQIIRPDQKFSAAAPPNLDGVNVLRIFASCTLPGECCDKVAHGLALVRALDYNDPQVINRSRCLRKLIKET